ncbi:MAG TPA: AlpA family phage regulatory protein [Syntrophales bacterium]|nr:AlpA family phage regulatory protein [Syntrophales bacterium]
MSKIYIKDKDIANRFDVDRATIWRWSKNGNFPKPIKMSDGCTRWSLNEIENWEQEQVERRKALK